MVKNYSTGQRLAAEFLGSLLLTFTAISPVILGCNVLGASIAIAVLMDAVAVGLVLFVLIETLGPVSGCHHNPAVTIAMLLTKNINTKLGILYILVQILVGFLGILAGHAMFAGQDFFQWVSIAEAARNGGACWAEFVGTFTLVLVIFGAMHNRSSQSGMIIGSLAGVFLITTSSTMFANPQVSIARMFTWSAAGIRPTDAVVFVVIEILAAAAAAGAAKYLFQPQNAS